MKTTLLKKLIRNSLIFSVLLLFLSCENLFEHNIDNDSEKKACDNKTYLQISYKASNTARTIYPPVINLNDFESPVLTGIQAGETEVKDFNITDLTTSNNIEILPGRWTFTLSAVYEYIPEPGADPIYVTFKDTVTKDISQGHSNHVEFDLKPQGDSGGFKLHLDLSTNTDIDTVKATLKNLSGSTIKTENLDMSDKSDVIFSHTNLASGTYYVLYEFFTGDIPDDTENLANDPTPINQWESYVRILPPFLTEETVNINFNNVYTITYKDADGNEIDFSDPVTSSKYEGIFIKKFSIRSNFNLPVCTERKDDKVCIGWTASSDLDTANAITKITPGNASNLILKPYYADPVVYVSADGDDSNHGFNSFYQVTTIDKACELIKNYGYSSLNWTIKVDGTITGPHSSGSYGRSSIISENVSTDTAKSVLLTGVHPFDPDTDDSPQDVIDRGFAASTNGTTNGNALLIDTPVPVTIKHLKITRGTASDGSAIKITEGSTLTLDDGIVVIKNYIQTGSGTIHNEGTLFICGTAVIGDKTPTTTYPYGSSSTSHIENGRNANYGDSGGGVYNGKSDGSKVAKLYIGYSGFDDSGTPVVKELTKGFYRNAADNGGAVYNAKNSFVYFDSGIMTWNGTSGGGGAIYNLGTLTMTGGSIIKNTDYEGGGYTQYGCGVYNGSGAKFIMSSGVINQNEPQGNQSYGGGVYNSGLFFMHGDAVIGNSSADTVATADACGNKAEKGGGIYNNSSGTVYIGYKPGSDGISPVTDDTSNTSICQNYSYFNGNEMNFGGGAICSEGAVKIASGTIAYNAALKNGGGIQMSRYQKILSVTGGTISNNQAGRYAGAIFLYGDSDTILELGGNPSIPAGADNSNDIYIDGSKTNHAIVKVISSLSSGFTATLNFSNYDSSMTPLIVSDGVNIAEEYQKFSIKDEILNGRTKKWKMGETGKLVPQVSNLYVGESAAPGDGTSEDQPAGTINALIAHMTDSTQDYIVTVISDINGNQSLNGTIYANSITLKGKTGSEKIIGNDTGSTLSVDTSVPVAITNLTLTGGGGYSDGLDYKGGGLYLASGSTVSLESGAVISGNTLYGSSNGYGGGVYVSGTATLIQDNATITENISIKYGGGIYVADGGTYKLLKGSVTNNSFKTGVTEASGGGVYLADGATMEMLTAGTISSNKAEADASYGAGIYVSETASLSIGKDARISYNNDTYLAAVGGSSVVKVKIVSKPSGTESDPTITITPQIYTENAELFEISDGVPAYNVRPAIRVTPQPLGSEGALQYWNVVSESEGGNYYLRLKKATGAGLNVTIVNNIPNDIQVTVEKDGTPVEGSFTITDTGTISFTAEDGFESYTWYIDTIEQTSLPNEKILSFDTSSLTDGVYNIFLDAIKESRHYSYTAQLKVGNE